MSKNNGGKKLLLMSVAVIAVCGASFYYFGGKDGAGVNGIETQAGGQAMPVPVVTVEKKPLELWKSFSGRLMAVDYVEIQPQVSGLLEKIHFEDGQIVQKGDVLFTIDPRPYEAAVAQAKADLAAAQDDYAYAQQELARAEELLKTNAISKAGYDQRINTQKVNKSAIAGAQARLKSAQVDLDRATIEAPISGRISRAEITVGNLITAALVASASAPMLASIVSNDGIYADFEVDEQTYVKYLRAQNTSLSAEQAIPVRITLAGKTYEGKIKSFDNRIDPSSGTIRARALFSNEDGSLLPGMFAKVEVSAGTEDTIAVSEAAIGTDQSKKFVYIIGDGDKATYREVKLGDAIAGQRIVLSGLNPGDRVITNGLMKIQPNMPVQPMSEADMAAMQQQQAAAAAGGGAAPAEAPAEAKAEEPAVETPAAADAVPAETAPTEGSEATAGEAPVEVAPNDGTPVEEAVPVEAAPDATAPDAAPESDAAPK